MSDHIKKESKFRSFLKKTSSVNIAAILALIALNIPRIFEDIAQVRFIYTGKPWNDLTTAANISPNFLVWEIIVFGIDIFLIFFLVWQIFRNYKRYSTE